MLGRKHKIQTLTLNTSYHIVFAYELRHEKTVFHLSENKGADQLCSNCTADQHLSFRYSDSAIPLLVNPNFQASSPLL